MVAMRFVMRGAGVGALLGVVLGLVLGLVANPPTVWFAMLEIGVPGVIAGAVIGLIIWVVAMLQRSRTRSARDATESSSTQPS